MASAAPRLSWGWAAAMLAGICVCEVYGGSHGDTFLLSPRRQVRGLPLSVSVVWGTLAPSLLFSGESGPKAIVGTL